LQTLLEFAGDRLRWVPLTDRTALPQEVKDREIGCSAAIGQALPDEIRHPLVLETLQELREQPGLAQPRLAYHTHRLALTAFHVLQQLV
jgi:hypothetical protein